MTTRILQVVTNGDTTWTDYADGRTVKNVVTCQECKYCGEPITLHDTEYVTHKDGTVAHQSCHEGAEFDRENAADSRD